MQFPLFCFYDRLSDRCYAIKARTYICGFFLGVTKHTPEKRKTLEKQKKKREKEKRESERERASEREWKGDICIYMYIYRRTITEMCPPNAFVIQHARLKTFCIFDFDTAFLYLDSLLKKTLMLA